MAKTATEVVNGTKYYYKYVELPRNSEGKRIRKKIRAKTVRELNELVEEFKNRQALGLRNQSEKFGELFKTWLYTHHLKDKAASTKETYERLERLYITPSNLFGIKIKDLTPLKIQHCYNQMELTPYLLQSVSRLINTFLKYLYKANYTQKDFSTLVSVPKYQTEEEVEIFTKIQQAVFIKECHKNSRYKNALLFALYTGIRIGELEALTWEDIKNNKITINKTFRFVKNLNNGRYEPLISAPKTKSSRRTLVLNNKALEILKDQKKQSNLLKLRLGNKFKHPELIFTNMQGNYLEPATIRKALKEVCINAELPTVKFHALRHTYASRLIEHGVNIKIISQNLGHTSTAITEKVYLHILEEFKMEENHLINQIF